jgi:hypothetical protein
VPDAGDDEDGGAVSVFQQGVAGYVSTRSVGLSTYGGLGAPGAYNANGMTFGDGANDWCMGTAIPGAPAYDEVWLLRFDDLQLPAGARVVAATLSFSAVHYEAASIVVTGRYLARPWSAATT